MKIANMKKIKIATIVHLLSAVLLVVFSISLVLVYGFPHRNPWVSRFAEHSPYPLAIIQYTHGLTFQELTANMESVKRFYENQDFSQIGLRVDFSTDEGKERLKVREKEVLNKMVEDKAIEILAREKGITISKEMAKQGVTRKLEEYGSGEDVTKNLERLYGWSLDDFEEKIVLPSLYQEKLEQAYMKEVDTTGAAKGKIEKAKKLLSTGKSFEEVAKEFSEGQTASQGGELGWFTLEDLAPELRKPVALQKIGMPSDIVESSLGYHILYVDEIKKDKDKQLYKLRQIFARKKLFADWLTERLKQMHVTVLSPDYVWDKGTARIEFRSSELRDFEKEIYKKTNGDAMFFF